MRTQLVPQNTKGIPCDLEYSLTFTFRKAADACFKQAARRLLNPSIWHELAGWASADFKLIGETGLEEKRPAREGDYLGIDIPGPGPDIGDGLDWVQVEKIDDHCDPLVEEEWIGLKVHPCRNPMAESMDTAHFFQDEASSSFVIERVGNKVTAYYYGRNEVPNTLTENVLDNIRNAIIAAGAELTFSKLQWHSLIKGLLSDHFIY